jgi:hypothetical protein
VGIQASFLLLLSGIAIHNTPGWWYCITDIGGLSLEDIHSFARVILLYMHLCDE